MVIFISPRREDPLTGVIPIEPGAAPYANWNDRIFAECYRPNVEQGNFGKISYNIGPTLMTWLAAREPLIYQRILDQDRQNFDRHGVGNAIAQPYNHTILPLGTRLDKETQIRWGITDFKSRYGHEPQGMWLPETAVDLETLSIMASHGIQFTILAPWQTNCNFGESSLPCKVSLPGKRQITIFFYNQDMSTRVSFDPGATINADTFLIDTLLPQYERKPAAEDSQLILLASDGELYGHHQKFRDKFLSYLMDGAMRNQTIELTYPGLWLKSHPPDRTVTIRENTSWSCHHGVTRWQGECDCTPGSKWKAPLRKGLNLLAGVLDDIYFNTLSPLMPDPWALRHEYIQVVLGKQTVAGLVESIMGRQPNPAVLSRVRYLLAAQFERQRMFTSCGWFFDEFDRIEPRNNVTYAAQAVWLTYKATGIDLTNEAVTFLKGVRSQRTDLRAEGIFNRMYTRARKSNSEGAVYFKVSSSFSS